MTILFVNFLFYAIWFVFLLKKNKGKLDVYSLTVCFYTAIAFLGFFTFATGIYQNTFGNKDAESLSCLPYIFAGICVFLFTRPLREGISRLNLPNVTRYIPFLSKMSVFFFCIFCIQAVFALVSINVASLDYAEAYNDAAAGGGVSFSNPVAAFAHSKTIMLARLGLPFFYTIQSLLLISTKRVRHIAVMLTGYLLLLIPQILTANRGGMFFSTANLLFFIILFWPSFSAKPKRFLVLCLAGALFVMSTFVIAISNARFEQNKKTDGTEQIFRYFGEAYPNLGFNIWNKDIRHPYGARMFPNYSSYITGENLSKNYKGGRNAGFYYWERYVGIPMLNFKTLFGDLFIEFGLVGVCIITAIWLLMLRWLRRGRGLIGSVVITFFAYQTCVWGLFGANFSEQYFTTIVYTVILLWAWKKTKFGKIAADDKAVLI